MTSKQSMPIIYSRLYKNSKVEYMLRQGRGLSELREFSFTTNYIKHPEGSCLVKFGDTQVICSASVEEKVPPFLRNQGIGWITAEYSMLPRATNTRTDREASKGKLTGRTHEIQRLIGRSLRAVIDCKKLGERQIRIDCDVIQADGGTRTASICGGYVAMAIACRRLVNNRMLKQYPIFDSVSGVSCGIVNGSAMVDLDYNEDSNAYVDGNFVITGSGKLVEVQATGEGGSFTQEEMFNLLALASKASEQIAQKQVLALAELFED